jgi:hypothetical protein
MSKIAMKNIIVQLFLAAFAVLISCNELVHTQINAPTISIDQSVIEANGKDFIIVTATINRHLSTQQKIKITTTNGLLFSQPISNGSEGNADSVLVFANRETAVAYLQASLVPDSTVIISASIGNLVNTEQAQFAVSCPTEILVSEFNSSINVNETVEIELEFLRDDGKKVSTNQRIDCSATPADVVEVTRVAYSDNEGKAKIVLKALKTGTVTLNFTDRSTCAEVIDSKVITIN